MAALLVGLCACDLNARGAGPHRVPDGGLSIEFPAGLKVCRRMSIGRAYVGFSAELGGPPAPCNAPDREPVASMGVWTDTFYMQPQSDQLCRPDLAAPEVQARISEISFPDRKSRSCAYRYGPDTIQIYVFAEGVRPDGSGVNEYVAELHTRKSRLDRDLSSFRALLAGVRIGFPAPAEPATAGTA